MTIALKFLAHLSQKPKYVLSLIFQIDEDDPDWEVGSSDEEEFLQEQADNTNYFSNT